MRYQSRPIRSQSYLNNYNKQNKENQNILNIKQTKPLKPKNTLPQLTKVDKKQCEPDVTINPVKALLKDQQPPMDLKRQYSIQTGEQYSKTIISHLCQQSTQSKQFLAAHDITPHLRSKMIDWMIEVLSSYKMNEDTFFRAVKILDSFLTKTQNKQEIKDLHLIGVAAMWSGCKYEEIYPIKLETMYDKIARKKFTRNEILQKESEILAALSFRMEEVNVYDIVKNLSCNFLVILVENQLNITEDKRDYLEQIILYLSKMSLFSYELAQQDTKLLAAAVYFIALKTLQQVESGLKPEERLPSVAHLLGTDEDKIIEVSRKVLDLAKNFSMIYPNLGNLKKFNKFEYKKKSASKNA